MTTNSIITKSPADSTYEQILDFSSNTELRDEYINYFGDLRFGKILEDLDWTAGKVSYMHADGIENELAIVTAACDRIDLIAPLRSDCDLRIRARVNWVGRSSMEVGIRLESKIADDFELVARAYFIMVARKNNQAAQINQLLLETDNEKRRFEHAQVRQEKRRALSQSNYLITPPTAEESILLHDLFLKIKNKQIDGILISETQKQSIILMHPQDRNIHNKIFGGHTMRLSFELAWNIAYLFVQHRLLFVTVDHVYFYQPVEIGSIMQFTGMIIYTGNTSFLVEVTAEVIHPESGEKETTNVCYFTFVSVDENRKPMPVSNILPHTYEEGLKYLDGAKRYQLGRNLHQQHISSETTS